MRFGSVFSGIEAASVAWHPLGWRPVFFSEIAKFPSAVLAHHYPNVPNYGDILNHGNWPNTNVDVLCGGPPCQADSVAGKRGGMADPRGALKATYLELAGRIRPRWVLFEGVPGVRSVDKGRAFGALVGGLVELGYGVVWSSLDAQYFGMAQRRERVFALGYLGAWQPAAAVLFDAASLRGDSAPGRETREGVAGTLSARTSAGGGLGTDFDLAGGLQVAHALRADGYDASEDGTGRGTTLVPVLSNAVCARDGKGPNSGLDQGTPLIVIPFDETQITSGENRSQPRAVSPSHALASGARSPTIAFSCKDHGADAGELAPTLRAMGFNKSHANAGGQVAVAFNARQDPDTGEVTHPLDTDGYSIGVGVGMRVRRLTPRECERLQGFPDDYTAIPYRGKPAKDGPRYHALGNTWNVPVVRWIGERLQVVHRLLHQSEA